MNDGNQMVARFLESAQRMAGRDGYLSPHMHGYFLGKVAVAHCYFNADGGVVRMAEAALRELTRRERDDAVARSYQFEVNAKVEA